MKRLLDIPGIGPALDAQLRTLGIATPADLAAADPERLVTIRGVSLARAEALRSAAAALSAPPAVVPMHRPIQPARRGATARAARRAAPGGEAARGQTEAPVTPMPGEDPVAATPATPLRSAKETETPARDVLEAPTGAPDPGTAEAPVGGAVAAKDAKTARAAKKAAAKQARKAEEAAARKARKAEKQAAKAARKARKAERKAAKKAKVAEREAEKKAAKKATKAEKAWKKLAKTAGAKAKAAEDEGREAKSAKGGKKDKAKKTAKKAAKKKKR